MNAIKSYLIKDFLEAMSEVFQHCPEGRRFPCFSESLFHDLTFSSREETELVSGKCSPTGLGNLFKHHLPAPARSVPLGLLTLSPGSPLRVLLAKDRACSSACGLSDAFSQQPAKGNAEHGPVLQGFRTLKAFSPLNFFCHFEYLTPSKLFSS